MANPPSIQVRCHATRIARWSIASLWLIAASASASEPLDCLVEPHVLVDVSSSEIGVLASVDVDEADGVHKGDVVAMLQTDVERATFEVTRAGAEADREIELLRREHDFNNRRKKRIDELSKQKLVSAQDVDEVLMTQETSWLRLQAAVEKQKSAQLEATRDRLALERRTIYSPIDGVVVRRHKNAGEFVDGDPILELAQLDPLRIRVIVPITMFGQIQVGMTATILPELPLEGPFVASVTSIDPMMDAATATLGVRLSLPNPDHRVPPGLKCTLVFNSNDPSIAEVGDSADPVSVAEPIPARMAHLDSLPPLGAATMEKSVRDTPPGASIRAEYSAPSVFEVESTDTAIVQAGSLITHSCVTLGPVPNTKVEETISAVLKASDIGFTRRYASEKSTGTTESELWFDITGNSDDPMHVALMTSIREFYSELSELPIDCSGSGER